MRDRLLTDSSMRLVYGTGVHGLREHTYCECGRQGPIDRPSQSDQDA